MVVSTSESVKRDPGQIDEPISRILLPTVGTQASRHAAEVAFTIVAEENALVEVAHVIARPSSSDQFVDAPRPHEPGWTSAIESLIVTQNSGDNSGRRSSPRLRYQTNPVRNSSISRIETVLT